MNKNNNNNSINTATTKTTTTAATTIIMVIGLTKTATTSSSIAKTTTTKTTSLHPVVYQIKDPTVSNFHLGVSHIKTDLEWEGKTTGGDATIVRTHYSRINHLEWSEID